MLQVTYNNSGAASSEIPLRPMPIQLTEKAAEMVKQAMDQEELGGHGLRVGVTGGGCSGLNYLLDFSKDPRDLDFTAEQHGIRVFVDPFSAGHLAGTVIDYVEELAGSGFKFQNPKATRSCGCGQSFQS